MISYSKACKIASKFHDEKCKVCNEIYVTEIPEGWIFTFNKTGAKLTPAPQILVKRDIGNVEHFPIPPISNLKKLQKGKKMKFIE